MHNSYVYFASYLTPILSGFKYEYPQMFHTPDDRWSTPASLTFYVNRVHGHCLRQLSDCQCVAKRAFRASETASFRSRHCTYRESNTTERFIVAYLQVWTECGYPNIGKIERWWFSFDFYYCEAVYKNCYKSYLYRTCISLVRFPF